MESEKSKAAYFHTSNFSVSHIDYHSRTLMHLFDVTVFFLNFIVKNLLNLLARLCKLNVQFFRVTFVASAVLKEES